MATWDDVRRIATALPAVTEQAGRDGHLDWRVHAKAFAWERPLRRGDLEALGAHAPTGDVLGVRVADVGVKAALIADDPAVCFTTPHFDGYAAVLVVLDRITPPVLEELLLEAWLASAPKRLARAHREA